MKIYIDVLLSGWTRAEKPMGGYPAHTARRIRGSTIVVQCSPWMVIRVATKVVAVVKRMVPGKYYMRHISTLYNFEMPSEIGSDHCRGHIIV